MILAGDIGGTNSRLAFFSERGGRLEPVAEATYASRRHANLQAIVRKFVSAHDLPVDVACFGVAGPVRNGRTEAVNLAWAVDARELAQALPRSAVSLLNDLEAHAYGVAMAAASPIRGRGGAYELRAHRPLAGGAAQLSQP